MDPEPNFVPDLKASRLQMTSSGGRRCDGRFIFILIKSIDRALSSKSVKSSNSFFSGIDSCGADKVLSISMQGVILVLFNLFIIFLVLCIVWPTVDIIFGEMLTRISYFKTYR